MKELNNGMQEMELIQENLQPAAVEESWLMMLTLTR